MIEASDPITVNYVWYKQRHSALIYKLFDLAVKLITNIIYGFNK